MNSFLLLGLLVSLLTSSVWSLQVTPNSPCSKLCMDDPTTDVSDPNSSTTHTSDIVCNDADYDNTSVGRKFKQCLTCLQNSTASSGTENDQGWFFYNLRYAFDTCLFNAGNASNAISTPCSQGNVCGPLQTSVESSLTNTATMGGLYSYCTANNGAFVGSSQGACQSCLSNNPDEFYLSNFLVALNAGCLQGPVNGTTVGLNMTLFSNTQVSITNPITPGSQISQPAPHHKGISDGAIIGIAVAAALILLIIAAIVFIHYRRRRNADRLHKLRSPLDERFGAENISAPTKGAFSSPQTSPGFAKGDIKMVHSPPIKHYSISRPSPLPQQAGEWTGVAPGTPSTTFSDNSGSPPGYDNSPPNSGRQSIPTHIAYIPPGYTPPSSNNTSPAYNAVAPPRPSQGLPTTTFPQRSPSILRSNSNTSPRYVHHSPNPSLSHNVNNSSRTPTSPPIARAPSRSGSSLSHRKPSISPGLINTLPSPPLPTIHTFSPSSQTTPNNTNVSEISHPLPRVVNGRFENDDEARRNRERLFREGLAGRTLIHGREEEPPTVGSPESESSEEELWPGNY